MDLTVLGATGRTGRLVVEGALADGHTVVVVVRDPAKLGAVADRVRAVTGDVRDPAVLRAAVTGVDAVISALGPAGKDPTLHRDVAPLLVAAMQDAGVRRLVTVSGAGADVPGDRKGPLDRAISWAVHRFGGQAAQDKEGEHAVLAASSLDWTQVRPPRLVEGPPSGTVKSDAHRPQGAKLTRADLARFLLDEVVAGRYPHQAPFAASG